MIVVLRFINHSCWSNLAFPNPECFGLAHLLCLFTFLFQDALYFYARLQLNLTRGADDVSSLVEQLLDVIFKELDQSNLSVSSVSR